MSDRRLYHAIADAFQAEGADTVFALMGDGNMHWGTAMAAAPGVRVFHARHEHCACVMAIGHYSATGKPGVASVTCGPGLTQVATALASAERARIPLVVLAGESPLHASWHNQEIDQAPVAAAVGARYIRAHSPKLVLEHVRRAFHITRTQRLPVVIGIPYDIQQEPAPEPFDYLPSTALIPERPAITPDPAAIDSLAERFAAARRPMILAGRGAVRANAGPALEAVADASSALLGTTLPARGLFDHHPFSLGIIGGFASEPARHWLAGCDLVVAFGASMSPHVTSNGKLFAGAHVVQVDAEPTGLKQGVPAANSFVVSDARLAAEAVLQALAGRETRSEARADGIEARLAGAADEAIFDLPPGTLDPREVVAELDRVIPRDWDIVAGSGHSAYFHAQMKGRRPENFHVVREFGAIGNAISISIGVAATARDRNVVLLEGDGSLMMHVQELETLRRHGIRLLIGAFNDGAYGAEVHKLRGEGIDPGQAIFGRPDLAAIARGFGLRGTTIGRTADLAPAMDAFSAQPLAEVWDLPIADNVVSPRLRDHGRK